MRWIGVWYHSVGSTGRWMSEAATEETVQVMADEADPEITKVSLDGLLILHYRLERYPDIYIREDQVINFERLWKKVSG